MSYLTFLGLFVLPPILAMGSLQRGRLHRVHPRAGLFLAMLTVIALVYTTPWDNYLVWKGIWSYGEERVVGTIGYVPVEEYLFFLLQPLLAGLWLYRLEGGRIDASGPASRWIGMTLYLGMALLGVALLMGPREGTYLGLILAWAAPVLALQWGLAGRELWARRRLWAWGVLVPTLYLWIADAVAIRLGIWSISETFTLGPALGPLPLEEAVFFLVTNLLVVQGLLLFLHPPAVLRSAAGRGEPPPRRQTSPAADASASALHYGAARRAG